MKKQTGRSVRTRTTKSRSVKRGGYRFQQAFDNERKFKDTTFSTVAVAASGTVVAPSINLLSAGTAENELIGRKMVIKTVQIKGFASFSEVTNASLGAVVEDQYIRLALVLDTQANGAAMTIAEIFDQTDIITFNDLENSKRFRILKDWHIRSHRDVNWDGTNYFVGRAVEKIDDLYMPTNVPVEYGSTPTGVIGDVKSNNIGIVGFVASGNAPCVVTLRSRIRFVDS